MSLLGAIVIVLVILFIVLVILWIKARRIIANMPMKEQLEILGRNKPKKLKDIKVEITE